MSRGKKATIYDIAVAAEASATTVSLVLNNSWRRYRIKPETALRINECAERLGYSVNLKARGLRLSRSGLAGMIMPHYRNRFFAGLAEAFETNARARDLCPIVVSTHRHPANERQATEVLLAQRVELLFFSGVFDPDPLNDLCRASNVRCVNIDLPGARAPSVTSDNLGGARDLTRVVIDKLAARGADLRDIFFLGGVADDDATRNRLIGFREALAERGVTPDLGSIDCCGYPPTNAARSVALRYRELGRMPSGLFINGVTALEGVLRFTPTLPESEIQSVVAGCFDWDPFATHLPFDVSMVRQNVEAIVAEGFAQIDAFQVGHNPLVIVPTSFGRMGELDGAEEDWDSSGYAAVRSPATAAPDSPIRVPRS